MRRAEQPQAAVVQPCGYRKALVPASALVCLQSPLLPQLHVCKREGVQARAVAAPALQSILCYAALGLVATAGVTGHLPLEVVRLPAFALAGYMADKVRLGQAAMSART